MVTVNKWDEKGQKAGEISLEDSVFAARIKPVTVGDSLVRQLANRRRARANTKDRSEIRGGGRKPWRQKGTGRARVGSIRSPVWRGGAVAMGPRGEMNYQQDMPKKARRAAIRSILSSKVRGKALSVIAAVRLESPKTKTVVDLIESMQLAGRKVLFILPERDQNFERSVRNLPTAKALLCTNLNPHDLLYYDNLVLFEGAVKKIMEVLS